MYSTPQVVMIDIRQIAVGERLRQVDLDYVEVLKASIAERGLKTPIHVRPARKVDPKDPNRWTEDIAEGFFDLTAGGHRLYACRELGHEQIASIVYEPSPLEARLDEIYENLHRHELNPLDRAAFMYEAKQVYEDLHPETKNGANGGVGSKKNENEIISFSKSTAEKTGFSSRTIELACSIHAKMDPAVRQRIAGTKIAQNQSELLALIKNGPDLQRLIIERIFNEDDPAKTVKAAMSAILGHSKGEEDKAEARFKKFEDSWNRLTSSEQNRFLEKLLYEGRISLPTRKEAAE